jgi:hypothetical protein
MGLLAAVAYDPAAAVSKSTATLQALTAMDTTNLRCTFTVPASGRVLWTMRGCIHGAAGVPGIRLGVLEGATVRGSIVPSMDAVGTIAATTRVGIVAECPVVGLTPGASLNWDAAWGVEVILASSAIKYGGPNNATTDDAFGAFSFCVWDPA